MARIYNCAESSDLLAGMRTARQNLARGEVIVMPTDTVYGIAADAFSHEGIARLLEVKDRTRQSPPPVLVADLATVEALSEVLPEPVRDLLLAHAPGPITVILPARASLTWDLGDTRGTVALRIPNHPLALELLRETGPLAVSSANKHGEAAAVNAAEADSALGENVEVILDGGAADGNPSTILDATPLTRTPPEPARIVRNGALTREQISVILGEWLAPESVTEPQPHLETPGDTDLGYERPGEPATSRTAAELTNESGASTAGRAPAAGEDSKPTTGATDSSQSLRSVSAPMTNSAE